MIVEQIIQGKITQLIIDTEGGDLNDAKQKFAQQLAKIIAEALRDAQVIMQPGTVSVTGSAGVSTNPAPIFGKLQ